MKHIDDIFFYSILINGFNEPLSKDRTNTVGNIVIYFTKELKYKRRLDLEDCIESILIWLMLKNYRFLSL